jgi:hypothetical protein
MRKKRTIDTSIKKILPLFNQALMSYQNLEWEEAKKCFKNTLISRHKDCPSKVYLKQCDNFTLKPPADDWGGVFNFNTKYTSLIKKT